LKEYGGLTMVDEKKFMEITAKMMSDKTPLPVTIDIMQAWLLISGLQLACRHPEMDDKMRKALTHTARQFQAAIVAVHPEADELINMGWDTSFDVDKDGNFINEAKEDEAKDGRGHYVVMACPHVNKMIFVQPTTGYLDLACLDCNEYIEQWDGISDAPDWVPPELIVDDDEDE
jgi:hypothetical protein